MTDSERNLLLVTPEDPHEHEHADDDFTHLGLAADADMMSRTVVNRRRLLGLGALGVGTLLGAVTLGQNAAASVLGGAGRPPMPPGGMGGPPPGGGPAGQGDADTVKSANGQCSTLPQETQGPYPADGSNASGQTTNILKETGIVRRDVTRSSKTGKVTPGVPLTLHMQLVDVNSNCTPLTGHVIYIWCCTASGEYSLYSKNIVGEDYLRGAQVTDAQGRVSFQMIVPGCYAGRWPHIHFEVYPNLATAVQGNVNQNVTLVSQIAIPEQVCRAVYADKRYAGSTRNLNNISLKTDNVFSDGVKAQTPTMSGNVKSGYTASITVGIKQS